MGLFRDFTKVDFHQTDTVEVSEESFSTVDRLTVEILR
jgi:hypothetical protein